MRTAILVDGGFYRKMATHYVGLVPAQKRAEELVAYCRKHLVQKDLIARTDHGKKRFEHSELYRIFYYDCPPVDKNVFHPLKRTSVNFKKHPTYLWMREFLETLKTKRKLALRLGFLAADEAVYNLKPDVVKKLLNGSKKLSGDSDFTPAAKLARQEGIDFILDPMGHPVNDFLLEHVDGVRSYHSRMAVDLMNEEC